MRVRVGKVGKPHGLEGAFVVEEASEDPERFAKGATLLVEGEAARVVESKRAGGRPVIRLDREVPRGTALELDTGLALPLVDACVREVDLDGGRIVVRTGFTPG